MNVAPDLGSEEDAHLTLSSVSRMVSRMNVAPELGSEEDSDDPPDDGEDSVDWSDVHRA